MAATAASKAAGSNPVEVQLLSPAPTRNTMTEQPGLALTFKSLSHAPWIRNAVIPVNDHFRVSVSYGDGEWYVGHPGDYEVAIQAIDSRYPGVASLVDFEDNSQGNIFSHCNEGKIRALIERAKTLKYKCAIEVFDVRCGETEKRWGIRFLCADGYDFDEKEKYCRSVFGVPNVRTA